MRDARLRVSASQLKNFNQCVLTNYSAQPLFGVLGLVAQWIRHRPTKPGIAGLSPTKVIARLTALLWRWRCPEPAAASTDPQLPLYDHQAAYMCVCVCVSEKPAIAVSCLCSLVCFGFILCSQLVTHLPMTLISLRRRYPGPLVQLNPWKRTCLR